MSVRREFWQGIEVIHDVVYFGPDIRERFDALGLKGWWMAYFASRSVALGTPGPDLVTALFYGFAPRLVERALPDAWSMASREDILATRLQLARDRIGPALAPDAEPHIADLATNLETIIDGLDFAGRALAGAHATVPRPDDALGRLWWAATVLREYRGDSHVAVLVTNELDGAMANALAVADGRAPATQREARGWTEDEWAAAYDRLRGRKWVGKDDLVTDAGRVARAEIEIQTDKACSSCFDERMEKLAATAEPALVDLARAINSAGAVPFPNYTATFLP
jgi:hypothetical protein